MKNFLPSSFHSSSLAYRQTCAIIRPTLKALLLTALLATSGTLSLDEFERLHREVRPVPTASWKTIPWEISLLDAQAKAAKERKPIFIWAMDGHPLGCT